jgi:hypothetical protein
MGLFDKIKTALNDVAQPTVGKVAPIKQVKAKKQTSDNKKTSATPNPKSKKKSAEDPEKIKATKRGEPWVKILNMELDPKDPGMGAFELDWNDKFVANLIRAGYQGKTDQDIVDNWFQTICRNVVLETYEQEQADPEKRSNRRDLGNGRTEIS